MKYLQSSLFLILFVCCNGLYAQQNHFIYIQSQDKQPFYVKFDKRVFSSSASGYLIIPKLLDGAYKFTVGFPKNEWAEQSFICLVDKKDAGYLLKNFGEKGWGFFNLQTLDVIMGGSKEIDKTISKDVKSDEFSTMLSNVVNDPSIRESEPVFVLESSKERGVTVKQVEKSGTAISAKQASPQPANSIITKGRVSNNAGAGELVYIDTYNGKADTVTIFIAADDAITDNKPQSIVPNEPAKEKKKAIKITQPAKQDESATEPLNTKQGNAAEKKEENKFLEIEIKNPVSEENKQDKKNNTETKRSIVTDRDKVAESVSPKAMMTNSDCKIFASDVDFLKLRKKMVSAAVEENMLIIARKSFKTKCFTTEQIKNLVVLFLKDSGRYNFLDAAYPFVSDSQKYGTLENQLTDGYYINRFRVMIRH